MTGIKKFLCKPSALLSLMNHYDREIVTNSWSLSLFPIARLLDVKEGLCESVVAGELENAIAVGLNLPCAFYVVSNNFIAVEYLQFHKFDALFTQRNFSDGFHAIDLELMLRRAHIKIPPTVTLLGRYENDYEYGSKRSGRNFILHEGSSGGVRGVDICQVVRALLSSQHDQQQTSSHFVDFYNSDGMGRSYGSGPINSSNFCGALQFTSSMEDSAISMGTTATGATSSASAAALGCETHTDDNAAAANWDVSAMTRSLRKSSFGMSSESSNKIFRSCYGPGKGTDRDADATVAIPRNQEQGTTHGPGLDPLTSTTKSKTKINLSAKSKSKSNTNSKTHSKVRKNVTSRIQSAAMTSSSSFASSSNAGAQDPTTAASGTSVTGTTAAAAIDATPDMDSESEVEGGGDNGHGIIDDTAADQAAADIAINLLLLPAVHQPPKEESTFDDANFDFDQDHSYLDSFEPIELPEVGATTSKDMHIRLTAKSPRLRLLAEHACQQLQELQEIREVQRGSQHRFAEQEKQEKQEKQCMAFPATTGIIAAPPMPVTTVDSSHEDFSDLSGEDGCGRRKRGSHTRGRRSSAEQGEGQRHGQKRHRSFSAYVASALGPQSVPQLTCRTDLKEPGMLCMDNNEGDGDGDGDGGFSATGTGTGGGANTGAFIAGNGGPGKGEHATSRHTPRGTAQHAGKGGGYLQYKLPTPRLLPTPKQHWYTLDDYVGSQQAQCNQLYSQRQRSQYFQSHQQNQHCNPPPNRNQHDTYPQRHHLGHSQSRELLQQQSIQFQQRIAAFSDEDEESVYGYDVLPPLRGPQRVHAQTEIIDGYDVLPPLQGPQGVHVQPEQGQERMLLRAAVAGTRHSVAGTAGVGHGHHVRFQTAQPNYYGGSSRQCGPLHDGLLEESQQPQTQQSHPPHCSTLDSSAASYPSIERGMGLEASATPSSPSTRRHHSSTGTSSASNIVSPQKETRKRRRIGGRGGCGGSGMVPAYMSSSVRVRAGSDNSTSSHSDNGGNGGTDEIDSDSELDLDNDFQGGRGISQDLRHIFSSDFLSRREMTTAGGHPNSAVAGAGAGAGAGVPFSGVPNCSSCSSSSCAVHCDLVQAGILPAPSSGADPTRVHNTGATSRTANASGRLRHNSRSSSSRTTSPSSSSSSSSASPSSSPGHFLTASIHAAASATSATS